jgi:hypothetical protein
MKALCVIWGGKGIEEGGRQNDFIIYFWGKTKAYTVVLRLLHPLIVFMHDLHTQKTPLGQHLQKPKPFNKLVIFFTHAHLN